MTAANGNGDKIRWWAQTAVFPAVFALVIYILTAISLNSRAISEHAADIARLQEQVVAKTADRYTSDDARRDQKANDQHFNAIDQHFQDTDRRLNRLETR